MLNSTEKFYDQTIKKIASSYELDPNDISFEIKVVCFFNIIKTKYNLNSIDYSSKEAFDKSIDENCIKISNNYPKLVELFKGIEIYINFKCSKALNEVDKSLDNEDENIKIDLFEYYENYCSHSKNKSLANTQLAKAALCITKNSNFSLILNTLSNNNRFLSECAKYYTNSELYGYDVDYLTVLISKMHSFIIEDSFSQNGILDYSPKNKYDAVYFEYPLDSDYKNEINNSKATKYGWDFIYEAINSTSKEGTTIVLVPVGLLTSSQEREKRKEILDKGILNEIIYMPSGICCNTNVSLAFMIFSQRYKSNSVRMVNATDCVLKTKGALKQIDLFEFDSLITHNDATRIQPVDYQKIEENNYNLSFYTYSFFKTKFENSIKIKDFAEILSGFQYTSKTVLELEPNKGNVSVARISNIDNGGLDYDNLLSINIEESKIKKYLLQENDIIISAKGTSDKVALIQNIEDRKIIPYNNLLVIRITNYKVMPIYLYAFLNSKTGKQLLKTLESGSVIKNINKNSLLELDVPYIDNLEQEIIGVRYNLLKNEIANEKKKLDEMIDKLNSVFEDATGI